MYTASCGLYMLLQKKCLGIALCMHDENGGGMMDGDTFVKSLHSILQNSLNSATGITTQRLF